LSELFYAVLCTSVATVAKHKYTVITDNLGPFGFGILSFLCGFCVILLNSLFVIGLVFLCFVYFLVVSASAVDGLERLVF